MTARAKELFDASVDHVRRGDVRAGLQTLLDTLVADPGHLGALESAGRVCRVLGAPDDAQLFEELAERPDDPAAQYALAYRLVEQFRPDVARALLERALHSQPDDPVLRRELAFAQYLSRDFKACLRTLAPLEQVQDMAEAERLDVTLLQAEAALYAGRRELTAHFLAEAEGGVPDDDQRVRLDALHLLLGRAARWPQLDDLGLREWHFIQHGGVILKTAGGYFEDASKGGRFGILDLRLDMVAFLLQRLVHLLERLDLSYEGVVPASPTAAPLAHALAERMGAKVVETLPERAGRPCLLVAANAAELAPLAAGLRNHRADLSVVALNLEWKRDAPVFPEVVGVLADRLLLPWETRYALDPATRQTRPLPADDRPPSDIGQELVAAMDALPDDGGDARETFESFYLPLAPELVLGQPDTFPFRRTFAHVSPCGVKDEDGDATDRDAG